MKIAAITITYNDDYKFEEWCSHYEEYKQDIDVHIIVDNGSSLEYLQKVKKYFVDSIVIERKTNGGCTAAYNDGIKKALSDKDVDAVLLIANDLKLSENAIPILYDLLYSDINIGMVAPIEMKIGSNLIMEYGSTITSGLYMKSLHKGAKKDELKSSIQYAEAVLGGANMASRQFYEIVGLQDELLFMYSDEVDMGIRAKEKGFKLAVTSDAQVWHYHINPPKCAIRKPYAAYLIGRNKVYIATKIGIYKTIYVFIVQMSIVCRNYIININSVGYRNYYYYYFRGIIDGITKKMNSILFRKLIEN